MSLRDALLDYKAQRQGEKEFTHTVLFCIPVGFSKSVKLSVVDKLLNELDKVSGCKYDYEELDAARNGRLGKIIRANSRELPGCFLRDESVKAQLEISQRENEALLRMDTMPYSW